MSTAQDRDRNHLHPLFRNKLEPWLAAVAKAGFKFQVYETFRTSDRQAWLYASGRTRSGPVLTYTLDSAHEYGVASDGMVLVWNGRAWVADWSAAAYNRVFRAVPPGPYGLELLSWERPHLQLKGVNGADLQQPASRWAAANGIRANVIVGSTWPPSTPRTAPTPASIPAVPLTPTKTAAAGRVLIPTQSGWRDARGERLVLPTTGDTVTLNAQAANGDVYLGGVVWPD